MLRRAVLALDETVLTEAAVALPTRTRTRNPNPNLNLNPNPNPNLARTRTRTRTKTHTLIQTYPQPLALTRWSYCCRACPPRTTWRRSNPTMAIPNYSPR